MRPYVFLDQLIDKSYVITHTITNEKISIPAGNIELICNNTGNIFSAAGVSDDDEEYLDES